MTTPNTSLFNPENSTNFTVRVVLSECFLFLFSEIQKKTLFREIEAIHRVNFHFAAKKQCERLPFHSPCLLFSWFLYPKAAFMMLTF
jgi:hypothetical protein